MRNHDRRISRLERVFLFPRQSHSRPQDLTDEELLAIAMPFCGESIDDMSDEEVDAELERIAGIFGDERFNALARRVMR